MPVTDAVVSEPRFRADLARSARLLRAFRTEQDDPSGYYTSWPRCGQPARPVHRSGRERWWPTSAAAPGISSGLCADAAPAPCAWTPPSGELAAQGRPGPGSTIGSALRLPFASGAVDVCFSSNVLEHVGDWAAMLAEMVRVTRPGGVVFVSPSPTGCRPGAATRPPRGTTSVGERAARRYRRQHGRPPKNRSAAACTRSRWPAYCAGRGRPAGDVLIDAVPRYLPGWTRPVLAVPGAARGPHLEPPARAAPGRR